MHCTTEIDSVVSLAPLRWTLQFAPLILTLCGTSGSTEIDSVVSMATDVLHSVKGITEIDFAVAMTPLRLSLRC